MLTKIGNIFLKQHMTLNKKRLSIPKPIMGNKSFSTALKIWYIDTLINELPFLIIFYITKYDFFS